MQLPLSTLQPYMSQYLIGGWKKDNLELQAVDFTPGQIRGIFHVTNYFMPGDGVFHFTVPLAFIWIAQLAIIYACVEHDLKEKPGEVYLREIDIKCNTMINKTDGIEILLNFNSKRYLQNKVYYIGKINIDDAAFTGAGKFIFPLS